MSFVSSLDERNEHSNNSNDKRKKLESWIETERYQWSKSQREDPILSPVGSLGSEFSVEEVYDWVEKMKDYNVKEILTNLEKIKLSLCSPSLRKEERLFEILKEFEEFLAEVRKKDVRQVKKDKMQREKNRQREEEKKKKKRTDREQEKKSRGEKRGAGEKQQSRRRSLFI